MRKRRRYRRRMRAGGLLVVLLSLSLILVSCVAGSRVLWVRAVLGLDVSDYDAEPVTSVLSPEDPTALALVDVMEPLLWGGELPEDFHGSAEAVSRYRDCILSWMLSEQYAAYSRLAASYDPMISVLIPADDFEKTVYRHFGGLSVSHRGGELFRFLPDGGYTAPIACRTSPAGVTPLQLEETAHTWRLTFTLSGPHAADGTYLAVFVRRADGTCYWNSLTRV